MVFYLVLGKAVLGTYDVIMEAYMDKVMDQAAVYKWCSHFKDIWQSLEHDP